MKVVNESARKTTSPRGAARGARALAVPADQRLAREARQRAAAVDPGDALEQRARHRQVRERRGGGAEPVEPPDRAEQPRAQRHAVDRPGSARGTRTSASPCRRSAGTRSCTPCTRGRGRGSRAAARRPARPRGSGSRERLDERVGAPARGVLLLARGHVGRAHHAAAGLAAGADALAAVGGAAHPAVLGEVEVRVERPRPAAARRRAGAAVIGAASTITPGLRRPSRVEQRLDLAHRLVELVAEDRAG